MENEEKRMLGDYEVRQSIHIGKKEVVFGVNEADKYPFMVCFCTYDNPFSLAWATEAVGTDDYLEAMQIFTDRVQAQIEVVKEEQSRFDFDMTPFTKDDCIPDNRNESIVGKVVVINTELDNRRYVIESVGKISGDVSMRDITFQNEVGFPINRVEKITRVREWLDAQEQAEPLPEKEKAPAVTADRNNYRITEDTLGIGGAKEKFKANMAAVNLLHDLEIENRLATPEEQKILAGYVGWGGLSMAFDENNAAWANEFKELYVTLSPEEYRAAKESTLTAFYTPPVVIKAMYEALDRLGFSEGNILEPSCGTGNFFGLLPDSMAKSKLHGVEIDSLTGRIAKQLYQKANIAIEGFEKTKLPDDHFDVVLGNVPFGDFKVNDSRYNAQKFLIHDFFFAKALDKVRAGGVVMFITSKGTMDKRGSEVRKYIAQRAELLGAIRLPDNTFRANAGTEVTSDILILQKRDRVIDIEPDWVHLDTDENGVTMNSYFVEHPEMVLGDMVMESTRFGKMDAACKAKKDIPLAELLHEAVQNINGEIPEYEIDEISDGQDEAIPADPSVKNFSYTLVNGKVYFRENDVMTPANLSMTAESRVKGLVEIRDCVRKLIAYQTEDYPEEVIRTEQENLNRLYDDYTKKYGLINSRGNYLAFVEPNIDNMLKITNDGRKLALDQRMIDPMLPDDPDSKVNACVDNVYRIWEEHADTKATQLVFCDLSTPKGDGSFNIYDDIRGKLTKRGIPVEQVRFIHEATTDAQKKELFAKVRSGEVRVLLGSTPKMGAGTNVQDRLIAIHNLDCPWRPSDLEQRQGRIERQGNMFPEVEVYRYVTEQTFDAYLYQLVESKQKFISQIMTSKSPVRSAEDVDEVALSFAEVKMLATGDERFKEKMDLDIQVSKLRVLKQSYLSEHYDLEDRILKYYPREIKEYEERITGYEADTALAEQHKPQGEDKFCPMTLQGVTYTEKADAGQMLLAICKEHPLSQATEIGSYRGFQLEVYYDTINSHYCLNLCGKCRHKVELGSDALGNLTRIENELSRLPAMLTATKTRKEEIVTQLENAKVEVKKPFAFEEELKEKTDRLNALNIELNLNEKDTSAIDTEPEQGDELPERKNKGLER